FLDLRAVVVDPKGQSRTVRLRQEGPGRYEVAFPAKEVGAYMVNLLDTAEGRVRGVQTLGASVNYSPEFAAEDPNHGLLKRLAEAGGGKVLDPAVATDNPFLHDRTKTFRPFDLWWWLLMTAIVLFPVDVGLRRVQLEREELVRAWQGLLRRLGLRRRKAEAVSDAAMSTLLARKEKVRAAHSPAPLPTEAAPELFRPTQSVPAEPETKPKDASAATPTPAATSSPDPAPGTPKDGKSEEPSSTASRLLEAKRRARTKG
ncbi:MAG: hypothetical protein JNL97_05135, partial [Verrucomicrobiales bacterium]|nr:hypothetical protein [Verrucomicrobiales bacterium]